MRSTSDGTATITWDTDEPSDSRVEYGTDPGALTPSVESGSALVTSHSLQLTGLNPSTTYHYRVSVGGRRGQLEHRPGAAGRAEDASRPRPASFTDTTVADFAAGLARAPTRGSGRAATAR